MVNLSINYALIMPRRVQYRDISRCISAIHCEPKPPQIKKNRRIGAASVPASQAGRHRFDPGRPLHQISQLNRGLNRLIGRFGKRPKRSKRAIMP